MERCRVQLSSFVRLLRFPFSSLPPRRHQNEDGALTLNMPVERESPAVSERRRGEVSVGGDERSDNKGWEIATNRKLMRRRTTKATLIQRGTKERA